MSESIQLKIDCNLGENNLQNIVFTVIKCEKEKSNQEGYKNLENGKMYYNGYTQTD